MTVGELKKELNKYDDNTEVACVDVYSGQVIELEQVKEVIHNDFFGGFKGIGLYCE